MQKIVNYLLLLFAIVYTVVMTVTLSGCKAVRVVQIETVTKDSIIFKDHYVTIQVPPTRIPGDTVKLTDTVPCPDAQWKGSKKSKSGRTTVSASLDKGLLSIDCAVDSLLHENDSLKAVVKNMESYKTVATTETVEVPTPYVPWWVYVTVGLCILIAVKLSF
jgi:hypothetical protein